MPSPNKPTSGKKIAKDSIFNLLGLTLPLLFAAFFMPRLLRGFGIDRFGILNLAWIILGYFSLFDLGIGKALTKLISERIRTALADEIPHLFWVSIFVMLAISLATSALLYYLLPSVLMQKLKIPPGLYAETKTVFFLLIFAVPVITTTAALRGCLEAYQEFKLVNLLRLIMGIITYSVPALLLIYSDSLIYVVGTLLLFRIIFWGVHLFYCIRINPQIGNLKILEFRYIKIVFGLSTWITISNFISPILLYLDRFLIGSLISSAAVAYYTTPFDVITRVLIIPNGIATVLFPSFSANFDLDRDRVRSLFIQGIRFVFLFMLPPILICMVFPHEIISAWLGKAFADNSFKVIVIICVGVFFNGLAHIPFYFLQSIGKPDITAKIHISELPIFIFLFWYLITNFGIVGAAIAFTARSIVDALLMFYWANKNISFPNRDFYKLLPAFLLSILIPIAIITVFDSFMVKLAVVAVTIPLFVYLGWNFMLNDSEKNIILSFARINRRLSDDYTSL